ncbi:M20/M25/M40 family metallo-hydrolase [Candidatus Nomurabacteria bacterium]|nr:M20/M25/M40 family metallo-hydrolase [Candidatus Nomurabacteria bacterium]
MSTLPKEYTRLLKEFISFKSISTDPAFAKESKATAQWLKDIFSESGFKTKLLKGETTNPVVFASYVADSSYETILIYGHYDVQPAKKSDGWDLDPFTLTETKTQLIARGAIDNKGQVMVHIYTVLDLIKKGQLAYNVKFLIEGNEESGNDELPLLLKEYASLMACDHIMVSDGETIDDRPTIDLTFRGGGNIKVTYRTAPNAFHSGIWGGAVPSASQAMTEMLATLKDKNNKVSVSGFYKGAPTITDAQRKNNKGLGSAAGIKKLGGVKTLLCEKGNDFFTQTGLRPALEISGINTGYTGIGFQNIVPDYADARINIRTVMGQKTAAVMKSVAQHIKKNTPPYVEAVVEIEGHGDAVGFPIDTPMALHVRKLLKKAYGKEVAFNHCGGSIPIFTDFKNTLKKNVLSVSMAGDDCNMHGVHENFRISLLNKALKFSRMFFEGK